MWQLLTQSTWADRIGWVLIHSLWQFTLVALGAIVLRRALQRCSAATRYGALLAVMIIMVAMPVTTWFSPWLVPAPAATVKLAPIENVENVSPLQPVDDTMPMARPAASPMELAPQPEPGPQSVEPVPTGPAFSWLLVERRVEPWLPEIVLAWFAGVLLAAIRPLWSWHTVRRLRRVGISPVGDAVHGVLERTARKLGLARTVEALQSTLVKTPVVLGCFRPVVLLPLCIVTGLPAGQLEMILAHELAHVRRHDYLVNLLQTLVETLFFYHPAVWWLSRQIRNERENCCDDVAIALAGSRAEYGRALLAIEELRAASPALSLAAGGGSLLARIRRIAGREPPPRIVGGGSILGVILVSMALFAVGTWGAAKTAETPERKDQPDKTSPEMPASSEEPGDSLTYAGRPVDKSAAEIMRKLYLSREWIDRARSFHIRTDYKIAPTAEELSRPDQNGGYRGAYTLSGKEDPRNWCMKDEWAWDESHILCSSQSHYEGDKQLYRSTRVWDGSLAIAYEEQSDHKQYVLGNKASQFFTNAADLALLPWGPGDGYHLWWSPCDVVMHREARFIAPEDFELAGQEELLGRRCHVLQSRAGLVREYVGVADGRLYRREILLSREGEARQLAICRKIAGPSIQSLNAWWDWLKIQKPKDFSRAYRAFQEAQFETARVYLSQTFDDYREVASGCWLSFRQRMDTYETDVPKPFLSSRAEQIVTEAAVNRPLPRDLFHFELADGVPVANDCRYDPPIHYTYRKDQTEAQRAALCAERRAEGAKTREEWKKQEELIGARKGQVPPPLATTGWINGGPLSWDQLRGKVVVLYFWDVHWVPNELPLLVHWQKRAAKEGVVIIGIHPPTDDLAAVRKKLADVGANYPVLVDSPATKPGGVGALHDWFGNSWWPNIMLVDKAGRVAGHGQLGGDIVEQADCLASDSTIVMVRAVAEDGTTINDCQVTVRPDGNSNNKIFAAHQYDGRWRITGPLPKEQCTVTVSAGGYQSKSQTLKLSERGWKELEVTLKPAAPKAANQSGKVSAAQPAPDKAPAASGLTIRIHARDARTKKPVPSFAIVPDYQETPMENHTWQSQYLKRYQGGPAEFRVNRPWQITVLRVEADGYLPLLTRPIRRNEGEVTLDLALTPDPGIVGKVLTPGGAPAGGAVLAVCTWTNEVGVERGKLRYSGHGHQLGRLGTTAEDGTFRLRGEVDPWLLVVAHDSGYAEVLPADFARSPNVRLRPWGRVEGEVAVNGKPVANQAIYVGAGRGDVAVNLCYNEDGVATDAAGRFSLDRVPPVSLYIAPSFRHGTASFLPLRSREITIAAGQTMRITLPRAGRAATGRVSVPADSKLRLTDLTIELEMSLDLNHPSIDVFGDSKYRDDEWAAHGEFMKSELGKAFQGKNIPVNAAGSFRIEGLLQSQYMLKVSAYEKAARPGSDRGPALARTERRVEIPPMTDSREPVDLGNLILDVKQHFSRLKGTTPAGSPGR